MTPATEPRAREITRMLVVDANMDSVTDRMPADLSDILSPGDLLVVNDAATLPASLRATAPSGAAVEIRLASYLGNSTWRTVLFGGGDWRTPTELRDLPEIPSRGDVLRIAWDFSAEVIDVASGSGRLVTIRFSRAETASWPAIYAYARPVQYSYLTRDLPLWSVQTAYASRPWAVEMASAGLPLTWRLLLELKKRGVGIAWLTHAAGLSAVGDEELDSRLPFAERFDIPAITVDAIERTHREGGGRVIAVGTTVVRALEGCAALHNGQLAGGPGETDLTIDRSFRPAVVDGIMTGVHDPSQSHFRLLHAFAPERLLRRAWRHAAEAGYLCHEFGDVCLILSCRRGL